MEPGKYLYQKQWEDYRQKQLIFWLVFAAFIPYMLLVNNVIANLFDSFASANNIMIFGFALFAVIWSICAVRFAFWKCPQCGKSFSSTWWSNNLYSYKCLHCKLPKYTGSNFYEDRLWKADR